MGFAKIIVAIGALAFLGVTAWSFSTDAPVDWAAFTADPWVALATADLYLGFVLLAVVIALVEPSPVRAALWSSRCFSWVIWSRPFTCCSI